MIEALKKIQRKIYLNSIGEQTQWKQGYAKALEDVIGIIEDGIEELIIPNNNYYVIMYRNGDKFFPYVEKMRLYKIDIKNNKKKYFFSRNLDANRFNTNKSDLRLSSGKGLRERVFFTEKQAEEVISQ